MTEFKVDKLEEKAVDPNEKIKPNVDCQRYTGLTRNAWVFCF